VSANAKRWRACVYYGGKHHHLGGFDTKQEAAVQGGEAPELREHEGSGRGDKKGAIGGCTTPLISLQHTLTANKAPSSTGLLRRESKWEAVGSKYHLRRKAVYYLKAFDTKQEAALAYDREARQCGEEKPLNYESMEGAEEVAPKAQAEYAPQLKPRSASGYYGVSPNGKRWAAQIRYGGKHHHLGGFGTKQEAALAYDREARQCGEQEKPLNYESMEGAEEAATKAQAEYAP
jgi:hypothetical protein